jgi:hypothetical protein
MRCAAHGSSLGRRENVLERNFAALHGFSFIVVLLASGVTMLISALKAELQHIATELAEQTDRGAAIIGCAIVDDFLTDAIKKRLILTSALRGRLFNDANGPLAHFSAKIDMGFALGLYHDVIRVDMHTIRRIRNCFAHSAPPLDFSDRKIAKLCSELRTAKIELTDPRKRYLYVCSGLSAGLAVIRDLPMQVNALMTDDTMREQLNDGMAKLVKDFLDHFDASMRGSSP